MDRRNAWMTLNAFVAKVENSLQIEMEQNWGAILDELRDESDHSKILGVTFDRTYLCGRDAAQTKVTPLVTVYLAMICITHNGKYDLVSDANYCYKKFIRYALICAAWVRKIMIPKICFLCQAIKSQN